MRDNQCLGLDVKTLELTYARPWWFRMTLKIGILAIQGDVARKCLIFFAKQQLDELNH